MSSALLWVPGSVRSQGDKEKPPAPASKELKQRLKKLEDDAGKIRAAMLKEIDAEAKKVEEAIKKAQDEVDKANKAKDRVAAPTS